MAGTKLVNADLEVQGSIKLTTTPNNTGSILTKHTDGTISVRTPAQIKSDIGANFTAGSGLTLSGTTFSLPVTVSGTGSFVQSVVQNTNGITVTLGTPLNTTYSTGSLAELNAGTVSTGRLWGSNVLNSWLTGKLPTDYVNTTGNQSGIAGNKTWTGLHTYINSRSSSITLQGGDGNKGTAFVRIRNKEGDQVGYVGKGSANNDNLIFINNIADGNYIQLYDNGDVGINVSGSGTLSSNAFLGTGTRMVVANSAGTLSSLPLPTATNGISISGGNVISPVYGTGANTIAQGNDSRINNGQMAFDRRLSSFNYTGASSLGLRYSITLANGDVFNAVATGFPALDVRTSIVPGSNGSSSFMPLPNDAFFNQSLTTLFHTGFGSAPTSQYRGTITVKGWTGEYNAWQLSGPANTGATDVNDWYLRSGSGPNWRQAFRIWHDGNLRSNTQNDARYLRLTGGTVTGVIKSPAPVDDEDLANKTYVDSQSVIEALNDGKGIGYRIRGRDTSNYGDIGFGAVDLSLSQSISTDNGATGYLSFAAGTNTKAAGSGSFAVGQLNSATGVSSAAFGYNSTASGNYSVAFGAGSVASGVNSFASGQLATASGGDATALGRSSTASGDYSIAMGYNTKAQNFASAAIGWATQSTADYATSFNESSIASGRASSSFGYGTNASGAYSTAFGYQSKAQSRMSVAMGEGVEANTYASLVIGRYPTIDPVETAYNTGSPIFKVGGGFNNNLRFNSYVLYNDGRSEQVKDMEVTEIGQGFVLKSPNGTRWRITVDNSGNLTTTAL